jgi:hypothetical protein
MSDRFRTRPSDAHADKIAEVRRRLRADDEIAGECDVDGWEPIIESRLRKLAEADSDGWRRSRLIELVAAAEEYLCALDGPSGRRARGDIVTTTARQATDENRPTWTWTNDLSRPSSIHVEPAFKPELGLVFVGIGERDPEEGTWKADTSEARSNHGIWLDRPTLLTFIRAMKDAATWAENYDPDAEA